MIYLRPSRRITSLGEGDPLLEGVDILEEYLQELQREHNPFTIVIESEHGSDLDKEGVRDTVLHLRIYGHDGSDLTDLLPADFAPEWYRGETQVGVGMSLALTWQDVKTYSQVYSVTLTAWRIYKALPTQAPIEPAIQRLLRDISCRGEFILQGSIRFAHDQFETVARSLREELEKKLNASDFDSFKAGDFKTASDRLSRAERALSSYLSELEKKLNASDFDSFKAGDFKTASDRLTRAERALSSYLTELEKKLNASDFDSFKAGDFKTASDRLSRAERALSSYLSELEKKLNASDFDSFKAGDFKTASDRLTRAERALSSYLSELEKKLNASDFDSFKAGDFKTASDRLTRAERALSSYLTELEKKLNASDFDSFKAGDFKTASDRLSRAERALSSYLSELEKKLNASDFDSFKAGDFKTASDRLTRAERALSSYLSELEKKLNASDFDSFKAGDFKRASDRLTSAERALSSYLSELEKKLNASDFDSFKAGDFKSASDRLASAERALKSQASELEKKLDTSAFNSLAELVHELPTSSTVYEMLLNQASSTYSVRVFTTGQIRNGKMDVANPTDPTTQQPAVLHSALACNLLSGQAAADFYDSLKWTVNKGRTTEPLERTTTGSLCYVLAQDIVHPSDGSAPYYDIQLERLT